MKSSNSCDHLRWEYPPPYEHCITGEMIESTPIQVFTYEDIDIGRFKCVQCGEVGYYTGHWKRFFEEGIPCPGSDKINRSK